MTARSQFVKNLDDLFISAGEPTLARLDEQAKRFRGDAPDFRRISDWRRGRRLPQDFARFEVVLNVLIASARQRTPEPPSHGLYDTAVWREWWIQARAKPNPRPLITNAAADPPYVGLRAYTEGESYKFFGRDGNVRSALDMIRGATSDGVFVLYAASGTGKSSFLHAGIAAQAARTGLAGRQGSPALVRTIVPSDDPIAALALALPGIDTAVDQDNYRTVLAEAISSSSAASSLLLIVDQFEQIFTSSAAENARSDFVDRLDRLARVSTQRHRVVVVVGVRADFVQECLRYPVLATALSRRQIVLPPMSRTELADAIEKPLNAIGARMENGLAARVIEDLGLTESAHHQSVLPLMSHVLETMWDSRGRADLLRLAEYESVGGVAGSINRAAENAWMSLDEGERAAARELLVRLVQLGDGARDVRRSLDRAHLARAVNASPQRNERVLAALTDARLLTVTEDGFITYAHEIVITAWRRLAGWTEEGRTSNLLRQRFERDAAEWSSRGKPASDLWSGASLDDIEEHLESAHLTVDGRHFRDEARLRCRRAALKRRARRVGVLIAAVVLMVTTAAAVQANNRSQQLADDAQFRSILSTADRLQQSDSGLAAQLVLAAGERRPDDSGVASRLLASQNTPLYTPASGHQDAIYTAAYSPDGQMVATASGDRTVRLWDVSAPTHPIPRGNPLTGHTSFVTSATWSPDGTILATASGDQTVRIWDVRNLEQPAPIGTPLIDSTGHGTVYVTAFSPDGKTLAAPADDGTTVLWDLSDPARPTPHGKPLSGPGGPARTSAFSPDGRILAVGSDDRSVWLWDVSNPEEPRQLGVPLSGFSRAAHGVAFSPDGHYLAAASDDRTVRIWDVTNPTAPAPLGSPLIGHTGALWSLAFSPDSKKLATASWDGTAQVWNVTDPTQARPMGQRLAGSRGGVITVDFSPDGETLVTGSQDGVMRVWSLPAAVIDAHSDRVMTPRFSSDGTRMATASVDGSLQMWDTSTPEKPVLAGRARTPNGQIDNLALSTDGRTVYTIGGHDGLVRIWDASDPNNIRLQAPPLKIGVRYAYLMNVSPDGTKLITGGDVDNSVVLWDLTDRLRPVRIGNSHTLSDDYVTSAAFSNDSRTVAIGSAGSNVIKLLDISTPETPRELPALEGHSRQIETLVFSPDGQFLASASDDQTVRLWDLMNPNSPRSTTEPLTGMRSTIRSVSFSADSTRLAAGSDDGVVQTWDVSDKAEPVQLGGSISAGTPTRWYVAYSPTAQNIVAAGGEGGAVRVWSMSQQSSADRICHATGASLTEQQWEENLPALTYAPPCGDPNQNETSEHQ